ncbi:PIN domain nuclease [Glycomyces sp. YM15]|uniref:PIN domain nuclease n=1 Tax=Glycomyces sp. YM15 TaxID=2800446 RepID=UPI0019648E2D|nr:PIN domain nuclease [Glycomyces sp. YM15]
MGVATHLIDTSVLSRMRKPAVAERAVPLVQRGMLALCRPVEMEIIYGARNPDHCASLKDWLLGFELLPMTDQIMERAVEVQTALVPSAEHRTVRMPDLLIAATAERYEVPLLHYDRDFDRIAKITGQPTEWVVPPGEAD